MRSFDEALSVVSDVDGWMSPDQAERLYDAAAAGTHAGDQIVEIGSFRGRSTIVLASAAPRVWRVVAIDPHAGNDRGPQELEGFAAEPQPPTTTCSTPTWPPPGWPTACATCVRSATAHASRCRATAVLYVDGAHRYAPARTDIRDWGARVAPGGTMLIHDSFSSVGVTLAIVRELMFGSRWRYVGRARSLTEYRADLDGTLPSRAGNAARQAAAAAVVREEPGSRCCSALKLGGSAAQGHRARAGVAVLMGVLR
jgi:hypothetical protein